MSEKEVDVVLVTTTVDDVKSGITTLESETGALESDRGVKYSPDIFDYITIHKIHISFIYA